MTEEQIIQKIKKFYPHFLFEEHNIILNLNSLTMFVIGKDRVNFANEIGTFFEFINSFNGEDRQTLEIIEVGVLEILTDTQPLQKISFELLTHSLLDLYNKLFDTKFVKLI